MNRAPWWSIFALALLACAGGAWIAYRSIVATEAFDAAQDASVQASQVLEATDGLAIALLNVQRGFRGYLLTRDEAFLEPYRIGVGNAPRHIETLRRLTAGRVQMRRTADALARIADDDLALAREGVGLARAGRWDAAAALVRMEENQRRVEATRMLIKDLKGAARTEHDVRHAFAGQIAEAATRTGRTLVALATGVGLALLLIGGLAMRAAWIARERSYLRRWRERVRRSRRAARRGGDAHLSAG
jgi:CHASE3 domain sensor protein